MQKNHQISPHDNSHFFGQSVLHRIFPQLKLRSLSLKRVMKSSSRVLSKPQVKITSPSLDSFYDFVFQWPLFLSSGICLIHFIFSSDKFKNKAFICRMRELPFIEMVQRLNPSVCLQPHCRLQECRRYPHG